MLTPYVIRGPEDLRRIYERKRGGASASSSSATPRSTTTRVYETHVDYRRKRGLLEEINLTALNAELEAAAMRKAERALKRPVVDGEIR